MAITKKPKCNFHQARPAVEKEQRAEAFIAAAGSEDKPKKEKRTPVMIRFDNSLLKQVDAAARKRGTTRSGWIQYTLSRALENGEG